MWQLQYIFPVYSELARVYDFVRVFLNQERIFFEGVQENFDNDKIYVKASEAACMHLLINDLTPNLVQFLEFSFIFVYCLF